MAGLTDISLGNFTEIRHGAANAVFNSLVKVDDVQSIGELTDEATIVDVQAYGQKYLKKLVGSSNASAIEVVCNYDPSDTNQQALLNAYTNATNIKIALVMLADNTGTKGTYNMFDSLVASATVSNSFDETRTITFSIVPTNGLGTYTALPNP